MFDSDYSEVASLPIDKKYWQIEDNAWIKAREELWEKDIKKRTRDLLVKQFSGVYVKEDIADLGNYFINGEVAPYETMILFVLLWLHPSSDIDVLREIKKSSDCLSQDFVQRYFYKTSFKVLYTAMDGNQHLPEAYLSDGYVGDRLGLLYELLILDNSSKWDEDDKILGIKKSFIDRPKGQYILKVLGVYSDRLNHNAIGQFFINEWFERLEIGGFDKEDRECVEAIFIQLLLQKNVFESPAVPYESLNKDVFSPTSTILTFDCKNHDTPLQRSMAQELFERIEGNINFPAEVSQLWDDTKSKVEDCIKNYSQYIK